MKAPKLIHIKQYGQTYVSAEFLQQIVEENGALDMGLNGYFVLDQIKEEAQKPEYQDDGGLQKPMSPPLKGGGRDAEEGREPSD